MGLKKRAKHAKKNMKLEKIEEVVDEKIEEPHVEEEVISIPEKFFKPLPSEFDTVIDNLISVDESEIRDINAYLECLLGIPHIESAFTLWFADLLLVQVFNFRKYLDHHYCKIFVSWLEGEMMMIEDELLKQKDFFNIMRNVFIATYDRILQGEPLSYWNLSEQRKEEKKMTLEEEELSSRLTSQSASTKQSIPKTSDALSVKSTKTLRMNEIKVSKSKTSTKGGIEEVTEEKTSVQGEESSISSSINPIDVLNTIINVTYIMFGDDHRYRLMYSILKSPFDNKKDSMRTEITEMTENEENIDEFKIDVC